MNGNVLKRKPFTNPIIESWTVSRFDSLSSFAWRTFWDIFTSLLSYHKMADCRTGNRHPVGMTMLQLVQQSVLHCCSEFESLLYNIPLQVPGLAVFIVFNCFFFINNMSMGFDFWNLGIGSLSMNLLIFQCLRLKRNSFHTYQTCRKSFFVCE